MLIEDDGATGFSVVFAKEHATPPTLVLATMDIIPSSFSDLSPHGGGISLVLANIQGVFGCGPYPDSSTNPYYYDGFGARLTKDQSRVSSSALSTSLNGATKWRTYATNTDAHFQFGTGTKAGDTYKWIALWLTFEQNADQGQPDYPDNPIIY